MEDKSWRNNNTLLKYFREDYAQDKKELDYLDTERNKKQSGFEKALSDKKNEISATFKKLCDTLNKLFEPFGFYIKETKRSWWFDRGKVGLFFKDKNSNEEYELFNFDAKEIFYLPPVDPNYNLDHNYQEFRKKVLGAVIAKVMDGLHGKGDKYYPIEAEDFSSYKDGISKLEKLTSDFQNQVLPIFKEASNKIYVKDKVLTSMDNRDRNLNKARSKVRNSYLEENPIAPGRVVIWHLQNGSEKDVEVISIDDVDKTAKIKTDGGAIRKVPLDRLSVDTFRPGIDKRY